MFGRYRWLLFVLVVAVIAAVVVIVIWRGRRVEPVVDSRPEGTHSTSDLPVESPEIDINVSTVRWTPHPGYTDWACLIECRESDGCHAEIQLVVDYISLGKRQRLTFGGRLDAEFGETVRIGRAQRPAVTVDRVALVTVKVLESFRPGAPAPTPML